MSDEKTLSMADLTMMFGDDVKLAITRTCFGAERQDGKVIKTMSEVEKECKALKDTNKALYQEEIAKRTKTFNFDFDGVSVKELLERHATSTTIFKKFYNDNLFNADDNEILKLPKMVNVKVKELLISRAVTADPNKARTKAIQANLKAGLTPEQILEHFKKDLGL